MVRSVVVCLAAFLIIVVLSACAGSSSNVAPLSPAPQEVGQPGLDRRGDIVDLTVGAARIESTYISALGQPCRKLSIIGQEHKIITECYDGQWRAVNEISGMSPVSR